MEYQPLVSIITIVYNGELYLEQTILSVLEQSYSRIEYIIIDGGSTDKSIPIIEKYNTRLAYWISEPDLGVSDAFNKGLRQATGEIIGIINADDWYQQDAVEKAVQAIEKADVVYGDLLYWKNNEKDMIVEGNIDYLKYEMSINHPTVFVKTACYKKYGMFNTSYKFAMDYELLIRLKLNGCSFTYIPAVLSNMRWEGESDKNWFRACKELLDIKNKYFQNKKVQNKFYFYKQAAAIITSRFFQNLNLQNTVRYYRARFSRIKKTYR